MNRYYVRQHQPSLRWQVVTIDEGQARSMKERGEQIWTNRKQAFAVAGSLNKMQGKVK